jgi:uncharacterized coiled-coil protein SlyX
MMIKDLKVDLGHNLLFKEI